MTDHNVKKLRRRAGLAAGLTVLALAAGLLTGCRTNGGAASGGAENRPGTADGLAKIAGGGCPPAGTRSGGLLPKLDEGSYTSIENPCLPYVDLVSEVTQRIVPGQRPRVDQFLDNLGRFADRLGQVNDAVQCAYQTDRLAVRIYQSRRDSWAVGVVAVVRGRLGAVADTTACFLIKQIPLLDLATQGIGPDQDNPAYCFDTSHQRRNGEDYTIMWIGSSALTCRGLQDGLVPGDGRLVAVKARPDVSLRAGPSTGDQVLRRVPDGTLGRVTCYRTGEAVMDDDVWARTTVLGDTGWIAAAYLDSALPIRGTGLCPDN
ncbi:SH3 domain-containing protein [Plantactinospora sonchi]|uniref:SH3 domain-containing protein n=1 Tax=Plantactinospora sonchi TaxID=1544735 RepID=A0ABU7S1H0_9ACTN